MHSSEKPLVRILVIDDEPQILELIREVLSEGNIEIITANSSEEGLKCFIAQRPGIVLVDLMLPDMDGMELLKRMLAADPGAEVLLMSGHSSTDAAVEAIQMG